MIRWTVLCVVLAIPVAAWCQQASSPASDVLTLEQAVSLAVENNVNVKNAVLGVGQSEDQLAAVRTKRLPALKLGVTGAQTLTPIDLTFKEGAFGTFPGIGPIPAERTTLRTPQSLRSDLLARAAQPLSQLYRIELGIQQSEVHHEVARQRLHIQRQTVVNNVKHVY